MRNISKLALAVAAVIAAAGTTEAFAKGGKCVRAGGEATMVTQDLAKFMAGAALKNSMAAHNWKPSGPVTMKCDSGVAGLAHCSARQKACS